MQIPFDPTQLDARAGSNRLPVPRLDLNLSTGRSACAVTQSLPNTASGMPIKLLLPERIAAACVSVRGNRRSK